MILSEAVIARMSARAINYWRGMAAVELTKSDADVTAWLDLLLRLNDQAKVVGATG